MRVRLVPRIRYRMSISNLFGASGDGVASASMPSMRGRVGVESGPIAVTPSTWQPLGEQRWSVPASAFAAEGVAEGVAVDPSPCVVQLGADDEGGLWFVDLEAVGLFRVRSPFADDVLRSMAASLALAPSMAGATLVTLGLDDVDLEGLVDGANVSIQLQRAATLAEAVAVTRTTVGPMVQAVRHSNTQQLRVRSSGERFEPTVVIANGAAEDPSLVVRAASGVAMVVSVGASVSPSGWGLWFDEGRHVLSPLGVAITPVAVGHHDVLHARIKNRLDIIRRNA